MSSPIDVLYTKIRSNPFLVSAKLEDSLVEYTMQILEDNVDSAFKILTNFAHWHNENLGHPAARVSIVHVHAYYLTKMYFALPSLRARNGGIVALRRANLDRFGGVPKQFAALMVMFMFYRISYPERIQDAMDISNTQNFRFINLRMTMYKAINDAAASVPSKKTLPIIFHNSGPFFVKSFNAIKKFIPDFELFVFTKGDELFEYVEPAMLPVDFGGKVTEEQLDADIEEFIRRQYAVEGLEYTPIDVNSINWKTYRPSGVDFTVRPESAISVKSIDYDTIDAQLEALGFTDKNVGGTEE
ncbi:hypothetical protein HDU83_007880 [Entophlyctis luteolus]|nr:hypothetical protein HDU82_001893 [Entophlyctis luteolus]KAJ3352573.1 hypothetical protein HDU83_007880 [Entophlyctis luteolus]KAJ3385153.1 hypothetical protein HDU84_002431 [Entophlyctis sp. JEL0112]